MPFNYYSPKFPQTLALELFNMLLDKLDTTVTVAEWTRIFARCMGGDCLSNEDKAEVILPASGTIWSTKILPNFNPFGVHHVVLDQGCIHTGIHSSGVQAMDTSELGTKVLKIWNSRVAELRTHFPNVCTVVLLKGDSLSRVSVYEEETIQFLPEKYYWQWDEHGNLEGCEKGTNTHRFSWQPHGSQFTVVSDVPDNRLKLRIKRPPVISQSAVLDSIAYDDSWIEIVP